MREREKAIVRSPDMADDPTPLPEDHHLLRDANDPDDWAWRRAIRQRPAALAAYRVVVLALGVVLILGGLALVPLPGPGWLVVLLGLAGWRMRSRIVGSRWTMSPTDVISLMMSFAM